MGNKNLWIVPAPCRRACMAPVFERAIHMGSVMSFVFPTSWSVYAYFRNIRSVHDGYSTEPLNIISVPSFILSYIYMYIQLNDQNSNKKLLRHPHWKEITCMCKKMEKFQYTLFLQHLQSVLLLLRMRNNFNSTTLLSGNTRYVQSRESTQKNRLRWGPGWESVKWAVMNKTPAEDQGSCKGPGTWCLPLHHSWRER